MLAYIDDIYIICAHYDSVTTYCADDNASSVAAVIEAARILSGECFDFTIVYALWDQEEIGLVGSEYYAFVNQQEILGVLQCRKMTTAGNRGLSPPSIVDGSHWLIAFSV